MAKKGVTLTTGNSADELYPKTRIEMVVDSKDVSIAPQLVLSTEQNLKDSEQRQARKNIRAVGLKTQNTAGGVLDFDGNDVLPKTDTEYITHNGANLQTILTVLNKNISDTKTLVDDFFANDAGVADVIDTLKDIQDYIKSDESGATQLVERVSNIETNAVRHDKAQNLSATQKTTAQKNIGAVSYIYDSNTGKYTLAIDGKLVNPVIAATAIALSQGGDLDGIIEYILTTLSGKQEKLVSGDNIKTVGGTSVLGSGNIAFKTINGASVVGSGEITITQDPLTVLYKETKTFD